MRVRYYTCDVFTDTRFGGNQLAVLPEADGLDGRRMQQIAREFNFSETTFVLPSPRPATPPGAHLHADERGAVRRPPQRRHAFVLAGLGYWVRSRRATVTFEEQAGLVRWRCALAPTVASGAS